MLFWLGVVSLVRLHAFTCSAMLDVVVFCICNVTINGVGFCTATGLLCCEVIAGGASLLKIATIGPLVSKDTLVLVLPPLELVQAPLELVPPPLELGRPVCGMAVVRTLAAQGHYQVRMLLVNVRDS
jgi:hypothetical protein